MLTGAHTILRSIEPKDLEPMRAWRNQPHMRQYFREYREISPIMQERWYTRLQEDERTIMFAIEAQKTGECLGACGLCYIHWKNRNAEISLYIGKEGVYIDDRYAPDALDILCAHAYDELNLHRLFAEVYAFDQKKRRLLEQKAFTLEGELRESIWHQGQWADSLILAKRKQKAETRRNGS